jgi:alpha-glucosidase
LIAARRQQPALSAGSYRRVLTQRDLLLYIRQAGKERMLIALNFGSEVISTALPREVVAGRILVSTFGDRETEYVSGRIELRRDEGLVIKVADAPA